MKYISLIFSFLILTRTSYSQSDCYKRIIEEASKIDTIQISTGTGFLINNKGVIITNRHVVEGSTNLKVTFSINGKRVATSARVIAVDNEVDLAILVIEKEMIEIKHIIQQPFPYGLSDASLNLGEKIYVLGFPSPDMLGTNIKLTDGIVSASSGFYDDDALYQISAPIQPGNSGSPMFDINGNIKGIIVASYSNGQVVNYAIKSKFLKQMMDMYSSKAYNSKELFIPLGSKQKSSIDFRNNVSEVSKRICLIENMSRKDFYEEFKLEENNFNSKSSSVFGRFNGSCTDDKLENLFKNKLYVKGIDRSEDEYLKNWVEGYFKDDFSKALFYTLVTNYEFSWNDFNYHYKLEYLDKIQAYGNIIQEHDIKYKLTSPKINELDFMAYVAGFFPYYFTAILEKHEDDHKKIRDLINYINLLIVLNDKIKYDYSSQSFYKPTKASLLLYKSRAMLALPKDYSSDEVCGIIKLAKDIDPSQEIWVDYRCK